MQQGKVHRQQDQALAWNEQGNQAQGGDGEVNRQGVSQGPVQIAVDAPSHGERRHQIAKAVVEQHEIGGFAGYRRAPLSHRHADVRRFQGGGVIDPIPCHGHHLAGGLKGSHQLQFLLGHHPRKDRHLRHQFAELGQWHRCEFRPGGHITPAQPGLGGDGAGRDGAIAGEHHHPHPCPLG